MTLKLH